MAVSELMPDWHPMLATKELDPGTWTMVAPDGREYGLVEIRRVDGRIAYRVTSMGRPAGYTGTLREERARIHPEDPSAVSSGGK